jgi:hypothetical protein
LSTVVKEAQVFSDSSINYSNSTILRELSTRISLKCGSSFFTRPLTNYEHMLIIKTNGDIPNGKAEKL